jgi:hypothetical protein
MSSSSREDEEDEEGRYHSFKKGIGFDSREREREKKKEKKISIERVLITRTLIKELHRKKVKNKEVR